MKHGGNDARQGHVHCDLCGYIISNWTIMVFYGNGGFFHVCLACVEKHFVKLIENNNTQYKEKPWIPETGKEQS